MVIYFLLEDKIYNDKIKNKKKIRKISKNEILIFN